MVSAGQCWHWFERPRAAAEIRRLLRPGGRVVIATFDWLPLPGNVVAATEELIRRHNPDWTMGGGSGLHPAYLADLAVAGFVALETFSFDQAVAYGHAALARADPRQRRHRGEPRARRGRALRRRARGAAAARLPDGSAERAASCWAAIGNAP